MPEQTKMVSSGELAKVLGKSDRTIQILAKTGDITCEKIKNKNQYDLYKVVQEYIDYLAKREMQEISSLDEEKTREEVRYKRAKADMMELELKELDGQMHSAEDVENITTDLVLEIRSALLSLPGRISIDVAQTEIVEDCSEIIKKEVYKMLEDLAGYSYDQEEYKKRSRERKGWEELKLEADD